MDTTTLPPPPASANTTLPRPPTTAYAPFMPQPQIMSIGNNRSPIVGVPYASPMQANQKMNQFSKGIYVTGLENTITTQMLQMHFRIKPIVGLKLPTDKFNCNKGFAFIYYKNADDASYVRQKTNHTQILANTIRVSKTVVAQNVSKMIFKLKKYGLSQLQKTKIKQQYFNQKNLQSQVTKIIQPFFSNLVQVNKIVIPSIKNTQKTLDYARGFFYISNVKQASRIVKNQLNNQNIQQGVKKQHYEIVLSFIAQKLNTNPQFSKYVMTQIYEYTKKNQSNVLHIKNINTKQDQDQVSISIQLRQFVQDQNKQANIKNCFVGIFQNKKAWSNVVFQTYEETLKIVKFRDNYIYANLRNVKDLRTVVISTVNKDTTQEETAKFLNRLAENSNKVDANDQSKGRKYSFASFNIIQSKKFYIDDKRHPIALNQDQQAQKSWRLNNIVPRRAVIHFLNDIEEKDMRQLIIDIKLMGKEWEKIFYQKDSKSSLQANHQKGHIQNYLYVRHHQLQKKKSQSQMQARQKQKRQKPQNRRNNTEQTYHHPKHSKLPTGAPRGPPQRGMPLIKQNQPTLINRPIVNVPTIPISSKIGSIPSANVMIPPMGGITKPGAGIGMSSMMVPQMGGMPVMGMVPQMGGMTLPMGGIPPPMGGIPPPMGGMSNLMGGLSQMGGIGLPMNITSPQMAGMQVPPMGMQVPSMGHMGGMQGPPIGGMQVPPMGVMTVPPMGGMQVPPMAGMQVPPMGGMQVPPMGGMQVPPMGGQKIVNPQTLLPQDKNQ